jgi:hypothetical protein
MFSFPGVHIRASVEVPSLALVHSSDGRIQNLAAQDEHFKSYLDRFSTEFGDSVQPSLLIWEDKGPQAYQSTEALAAFRDALAISVVTSIWARCLKYNRTEKLRFTNWFNIYPWMVGKETKYVVMKNTAIFGLHETRLLRAQTSPGLLQEVVSEREIDRTLHAELMVRFQRRFGGAKPRWDDVKLFRSLSMANSAALLPSQGDFTPYDAGRAIALWVSAFEILAHPGEGKSGPLTVYDLLEKADWHLTVCKEARHSCMAPPAYRRSRNLGCFIYSRMNAARNDYLHGNPVSDVQLNNAPFERFIPEFAAPLYRMALTGFLGLQFDEQPPTSGEQKAHDDWVDRWCEYTKYQRDVEAAIATFNSSPGARL